MLQKCNPRVIETSQNSESDWSKPVYPETSNTLRQLKERDLYQVYINIGRLKHYILFSN